MAPIRILVDTLPILPSSGGIRVYLLSLLGALTDLDCDLHLVCSASNARLFTHLHVDEKTVLPVRTERSLARVATQQLGVGVAATGSSADVLLSPVDVGPLFAPLPIVTVIHSSHINAEVGVATGLRALYIRTFMRATVRRSDRLIAISEYVREETTHLLDATPDSIDVVPHGGGIIQDALGEGWRPLPYGEREGGLLFVGSLFPHKNVGVLIRAYARFLARQPGAPDLTIVGKDVEGEMDRLKSLSRELGLTDRTRFLGQASRETLLRLYRESRMLVYPSTVEGFGLPPLEAMRAGMPVVASDRTSIPEVVGNAAVTVNPDDPAALASAMLKVWADEDLRQRLIRRGKRRSEQFTWRKSAERTLSSLRRVAT